MANAVAICLPSKLPSVISLSLPPSPSCLLGSATTFLPNPMLNCPSATISSTVIGKTVTSHVASNLPILAVIVVVPSDLAVTVPASLTVAIFSSFDVHVTVVSSVVLLGLIVSFNVSEFLFLISRFCGAISIDVICTGSVTVILHVAFCPFAAFAVIVAVPFETPSTKPLASTLATPALSLLNVTDWSVIAESCNLFPIATVASVLFNEIVPSIIISD